MISINEILRFQMQEKGCQIQGITAINPSIRSTEKCSWLCHHSSDFCKTSHVKLLKPYFQYTDKAYFGVIHTLQASGRYALANIILFVLVIPLLMYVLLVKSLEIQQEIKDLVSEKE